MSEAIPPIDLEYATALTGLESSPPPPNALSVARLSMGTAVLSGISVASCLALLATDMREFPLILFHLVIFSALAFFAATCDWAVRVYAPEAKRWSDYTVGAGLVGLTIAPLVHLAFDRNGDQGVVPAAAVVLVSFALLSISVHRAAAFYRRLASWLPAYERDAAARIRTLGRTKAIFETVWLASIVSVIGLPLSFFGLFAFAGSWIWMLVEHAAFIRRIDRIVALVPTL